MEEADKILKILDSVESVMLRRSISRYSTGSEVDKMYNQLAHEAFSVSDQVSHIKSIFNQHSPSDEEFKRNFAQRNHRQNNQTKHILDSIERSEFSHSGSGKEIGERSEVHIEHIAPRQSFSAKKYNSWAEYLDVSEQEFLEYRNHIGNLTLLETRRNLQASDTPFEQKKEYYSDSDFGMTRDICRYDTWSIGTIKKRSRELAEIAATIWNLE